MKLWIARDKSGYLFGYTVEPYYSDYVEGWLGKDDYSSDSFRIDNQFFPEIKPGECAVYEAVEHKKEKSLEDAIKEQIGKLIDLTDGPGPALFKRDPDKLFRLLSIEMAKEAVKFFWYGFIAGTILITLITTTIFLLVTP